MRDRSPDNGGSWAPRSRCRGNGVGVALSSLRHTSAEAPGDSGHFGPVRWAPKALLKCRQRRTAWASGGRREGRRERLPERTASEANKRDSMASRQARRFGGFTEQRLRKAARSKIDEQPVLAEVACTLHMKAEEIQSLWIHYVLVRARQAPCT